MARRILTKSSTIQLSSTDKMTINGTVIPTPSELKIGYYDIVENEYRDSNALMHFTFVRRNTRKLFLTYNTLTRSQLNTLLNAINSNTWLTVAYPHDPLTNAPHSFTCYVGDREINYYSFAPGLQYYTDITLNLIER